MTQCHWCIIERLMILLSVLKTLFASGKTNRKFISPLICWLLFFIHHLINSNSVASGEISIDMGKKNRKKNICVIILSIFWDRIINIWCSLKSLKRQDALFWKGTVKRIKILKQFLLLWEKKDLLTCLLMNRMVFLKIMLYNYILIMHIG